jgi:prolyl oligopeptidase
MLLMPSMNEVHVATARIETVVDNVFGRQLADPYRWMEQDSPERRQWLDAQADQAARYLSSLPERDEFLARITELTTSTATARRFATAGGRVFFLRQGGDTGVPALVVREGEDGDERVLLDPARFAGDEHWNVDWYTPSPDGRRVACGLSQGGSELSVLRFLDTESGELGETAIPGTILGVAAWLPDGSGLAYHCFRQPSPNTDPAQLRLDSAAFLHQFDGSADLLLMARGLNDTLPLTPLDRPLPVLPGGSDWAIAVVSHSSLGGGSATEELSDCSLYAAPRSALTADPASCPWRRIAGPEDAVTAFAVHADTLYAVSHRGAPRSQVLAYSLADGRAEVVVPGGERVVEAVLVVGRHLLVRDLDGGVARLRRAPLAGGAIEEVPLPVEGVMPQWTGGGDGSSALLVLASWTRSPAAFRYSDDGPGTVRDTGWITPSPVDFGDIEVSELRVPARDGVPVPLTVLHRRGLPLDGNNPTMLTGYGSYGYVLPRDFKPELLAWLERGGVYAVAGVRGGGEYGPEWHEAGRYANKESTITDFIDCAQHLVAAGYTRPGRLAGEGASGGGIPTGGALVRRPDLWAAMVMRVPVTNMTRSEFTENGPINVPEYGSVTTEEGLRNLLIIDCYLRVEDGTPYPAVLLTAGLNDPRVTVWEPAKMAARLQAATGSDRPVLLRVDAHAGHGIGSTRQQRNAVTADTFAFLLAQLTDDTRTQSPEPASV